MAYTLSDDSTTTWLPTSDDTIWSFDGDKYAVRLPTLQHLLKFGALLQHGPFLAQLEDPLPYSTSHSCIFTQCGRGVCITRCSLNNTTFQKMVTWLSLGRWEKERFIGMSPQHIRRVWEQGQQHLDPPVNWRGPETLLPWRPMLVPVNEFDLMDTSMAADNPDGSIVTGGSLYNDDSLLTRNHMNDDPDCTATGKLTIQDTDRSAPLQWVWINGCLLCLDVLALVPLTNLAHQDIIFSKYLKDT